MAQVGNRIIFDAATGEILAQLGEMAGDVLPRKEVTLAYVDLEYGQVNFATHRILSIDPATKEPVLEEIPPVKTPEQQRIEELENELLLATEVI